VKKKWVSEMTGMEKVLWAVESSLEDLIMEVLELWGAMERQGSCGVSPEWEGIPEVEYWRKLWSR